MQSLNISESGEILEKIYWEQGSTCSLNFIILYFSWYVRTAFVGSSIPSNKKSPPSMCFNLNKYIKQILREQIAFPFLVKKYIQLVEMP